ncbi:hypothetical protein [Nocardia terpenica]|uniref:Uncharacterized protein n=1 Tax=Nocardia terpenica TaxID=455432 RepID=A0A164PFM3_9NOCA|nr:hypothetical protein [Nocardia terpenica]ATL69962.1 hypothetical protein CRH09_31060 [Nocardia terpenica]KZM75503.1 hypothetical protein AWN90_19175 [Nocardia terpenica]NQE85973.1 hypothetical protein [Nocardia terpenica]
MTDKHRGSSTKGDPDHFGMVMRGEREARGWSRKTLHDEHDGPSEMTQYGVEIVRKKRPKKPTYDGYDRAFGWPPGTAAGIFHGDPPPRKNEPATGGGEDDVRQAIAFRLSGYSPAELGQVLDLLKIVEGMRKPTPEGD